MLKSLYDVFKRVEFLSSGMLYTFKRRFYQATSELKNSMNIRFIMFRKVHTLLTKFSLIIMTAAENQVIMHSQKQFPHTSLAVFLFAMFCQSFMFKNKPIIIKRYVNSSKVSILGQIHVNATQDIQSITMVIYFYYKTNL